MKLPSPAAVRWSILGLLVVLWELVPRLGLLPELFLPSMSSTLSVLWKDGRIYGHALLVTLYEVALAMLIACGGGILIGAALIIVPLFVSVGSNSGTTPAPAPAVQPTS